MTNRFKVHNYSCVHSKQHLFYLVASLPANWLRSAGLAAAFGEEVQVCFARWRRGEGTRVLVAVMRERRSLYGLHSIHINEREVVELVF